MSWAEHFDSIASGYDDFTSGTGWLPNEALGSILRRHGVRLQSVWDLGAGTGQTALVLRDLYPDAAMVLVEPSPAMAERARAKLPTAAVRLADADSFLLAEEEHADLVVAVGVLELLPDSLATVARAAARLSAGGHLAVTHELLLDSTSVQGDRVSELSQGRTVRRVTSEQMAHAAASVGLELVDAETFVAYQRGDTLEDVLYELLLWRRPEPAQASVLVGE